MKKIMVSLSIFISMGVSCLASAEGNVESGKAQAVACAGCHGADGNSVVPSFPKLAEQNVKYLIKQMNDIKNGDRSVPAMIGQLDSKSPQDIEDLAAYYASQTRSIGAANKDLVELGKKIYRSGNRETRVPACSACHSPTGNGNSFAGIPSLKGQQANYIAAQLRAFREGVRTNDGDAKTMRNIAARLTNKEIDAVASYISGLH